MQRSAMRRCLMGLGGHPTSTDGFILGPSHGTVGRLVFSAVACQDVVPAEEYCAAYLLNLNRDKSI